MNRECSNPTTNGILGSLGAIRTKAAFPAPFGFQHTYNANLNSINPNIDGYAELCIENSGLTDTDPGGYITRTKILGASITF